MTVADQTPATVNRNERRLAFIIAGLILFGLLGVIANIVFNALQVDTASNPTLTTITLIPAIAFPAGILMIIVLMVVSILRRNREAREEEEAAASAPVTPPVRTQRKSNKKRR